MTTHETTTDTLTGSEKQIAWAADLRARAILRVERAREVLESPIAAYDPDTEDGYTLTADDRALLDTMLAGLRAERRAAVWINHRQSAIGHMLWGMRALTAADANRASALLAQARCALDARIGRRADEYRPWLAGDPTAEFTL